MPDAPAHPERAAPLLPAGAPGAVISPSPRFPSAENPFFQDGYSKNRSPRRNREKRCFFEKIDRKQRKTKDEPHKGLQSPENVSKYLQYLAMKK
ncbi:hypothetical protein [Paucidesulfovibrio longus]|uniref:hypothetical protein n=1 Tax=Paucidesulfovibrio longus TaxID=889 RepID=UPI0012DF60FE|nr:hypothetical protein [Paucidesulfovibrio longus]